MKHFPLSKLTLLLAALLALVLMTAQVAAAAPLHDETWKIVKSPNGSLHNSILLGVATISKQNAWAVGNTYNQDNVDNTPLIEHWNGSQWNVVPSPNPGISTFFNVAPVSANDIWAMGIYSAGLMPPLKILIEHWNGSQWSIVKSPNPGVTQTILGDLTVISEKNIWADGFYDTSSGSINTLVLHWNGSRWSVVPSPNPGTNNQLNEVVAVSANDIWAMGVYYTGSGTLGKTLIEHWNGTSWSVVPSPNVKTKTNFLTGGTVVSANDVWTVGSTFNLNGTQNQTLTEHWNGTSWSIVPSPNVGSNPSALINAAAVSANDIWAGAEYDLASGLRQTLIEHWNGRNWSIVSTPNVGSGDNWFQWVAADSAEDVWAVGAYVNSANQVQTLIEHCC